MAFVSDITERKGAEQKMRYLSSIVESADSAIVGQTLEGRITSWNGAAERLYGYPAAEVVGQTSSILLPEGRHNELATVLRRIAAGKHVAEYETIRRRKDGKRILVSVRVSPILDASGAIIGASSVVKDITRRRRTEEALRRRVEELEKLMEVVPAAVLVAHDQQCTHISGNRMANQLLEAKEGENLSASAKCPRRFFRDGQEQRTEELPMQTAVQGIEVRDTELEVELPSGRRINIWGSASPLWDAKGNVRGCVGAFLDVTEHKRAEEALIRSEKLASVGRMAATVAHEINNPLEAITNCIYLVNINPKLPLDVKPHLQVAERELQRVAHLTRQTLGFYRDNAKPTALDIRSLVDEVVELYRPKLKFKEIRLVVKHGRPAKTVVIASEIRQVISNLLTNAIDASRPQTTIAVRTSQLTLGGCLCTRVTVADMGTGISPVHRNAIFTPFFTTKAAVGTGLGLWVSSQIVQKHNGSLRLRSAEERGTVFSVFLPAQPNPPRPD